MKLLYPILLSSVFVINGAFAEENASVSWFHKAQSGLSAGLGTVTGAIAGKNLSPEAIAKVIKQVDALPAKSYQLMGEEFTDAKPILMQCIKDRKEITVLSFTYCCELALDTSYSHKCADILAKVVEEHNNSVKIGEVCQPENDHLARLGKYVWVNGVKKCASTDCKQGAYVVRNAQGQSQGWCKSGIDPHVGPVREDFDMSFLQSSVAKLDVKPIGAPDIDVSRLSLTAPATVPAVSEVDAKLAGIDAKAAAQKQEILNEARCKELGAKAVEMAACKKNPEEWGKQKLAKMQAEQTKDANEQKCLDLGLRKATIEFNQCKSDPTTYAANKQVCDGLGLNSVEFGKCMKNPTEYSTQRLAQLQAQQAEAQKKATCDSLGATSGANKNLCMENPDAYKTAKSQCDGMNAVGAAFNKCIKDPAGYKVTYDLEMVAQNSGMSVREYEQAQDREAEIKRLQQSLGLI